MQKNFEDIDEPGKEKITDGGLATRILGVTTINH
jgi:hypothetical protein